MGRSAIKVKVVETDYGFRRVMEVAKLLRERDVHVKVGVLEETAAGGEQREGGVSNAELAAIHEFGTPDGHIPERSFMRSTMDANKATYLENLKTLITRIVLGQITVDRAFNILGAKIAADIKKRVTTGEGIPPPNAPSTVARKRRRGAWNGKQGATGAIRTLIDTGRMIGSITWTVMNGK